MGYGSRDLIWAVTKRYAKLVVITSMEDGVSLCGSTRPPTEMVRAPGTSAHARFSRPFMVRHTYTPQGRSRPHHHHPQPMPSQACPTHGMIVSGGVVGVE
jgi:hypothetical protein